MWEPFLLRNQNRQFWITQCLCSLSTAWFHYSTWICLFFKWKHLSIPRIRLFLKCIHISPLFILSFQCRTGYAGDGYACGLDSDLDGRPDVDLDCQGLGDYMHCHKVISINQPFKDNYTVAHSVGISFLYLFSWNDYYDNMMKFINYPCRTLLITLNSHRNWSITLW